MECAGTMFRYFLESRNTVPAFPADTAVFFLNVFVNSVAGCNLELKIHQNVFAARASPQTPPGEITVLPQTPYLAFMGHFMAGEGAEEGKEGNCLFAWVLTALSAQIGYIAP